MLMLTYALLLSHLNVSHSAVVPWTVRWLSLAIHILQVYHEHCALHLDSLGCCIEEAVWDLIVTFGEHLGIRPRPQGCALALREQEQEMLGKKSATSAVEQLAESEQLNENAHTEHQCISGLRAEIGKVHVRVMHSIASSTDLTEKHEPGKNWQWLQEEHEELVSYFNQQCLDAVLRSTKLSLDLIRKRVFFHKSVPSLLLSQLWTVYSLLYNCD